MTGYLFRPPASTPESRAGRPPRPRTEKLPGMLIDRDMAVEVAPGEPIYVDVYRPDSQVPAAPRSRKLLATTTTQRGPTRLPIPLHGGRAAG